MIYYIKIDCPPGSTRPNHILEEIFKLLNINIIIPNKSYSFCGEWGFYFENKDDINIINLNKDKIINTLKSYYPSKIRYAEWYFD